MKKFCLAVVLSPSLSLALSSPFASEVPGLTIPNSHSVSTPAFRENLVLRGQQPNRQQIQELAALGIRRVLIFKNDVKNEVAKEIQWLKEEGISGRQVLQVPFPWKDLHDFKAACEMTVEALNFLKASVENNEPVYFHCTVGEDRTGYLAGLYRVWNSSLSVEEIFHDELCEKGYEAGNPRKPFRQVVSKIRETLTPTFLRMAKILRDHRDRRLTKAVCSQAADFVASAWQCKRSSRL